ncbi:hypothetical protein M3Y97_00352400 [Aphelenchoides bicaudatus]|nr:hypothetical protein M3Y97_00352400 [Aphelenchoides bicaudatus]
MIRLDDIFNALISPLRKMSNTEEHLDVHGSDLRRLNDLKPSTNNLLVVDASETPLKSFACNSDIGERTISSDREDSNGKEIQRLLADHNELGLGGVGSLSFVGFPALTHLDLSNNCLEHLDFISTLKPHLQILKLSNNKISNLCELYHFHSLAKLEEVQFDGNPVTEVLSDYKLLVLAKAIILGKLETVNGVFINEREELLAEALHFQGIRRFRPDNSTHETLLDFVKKTLTDLKNKQLETICSQQRQNSARRITFNLAAHSRFQNETTPRRPRTTPGALNRSSIMTFTTPQTSNKPVKKSDIYENVQEPESSSNIATSTSVNEIQSKLDRLFLLYEEQQAAIEALQTKNTELHEIVEKQQEQLQSFEDQLNIVPANMRIKKRNNGLTAEFFLEWDNHLQAMNNVKNYELNLGDENQVYSVRAPQRRVIVENPIDGQKVLLRAIHKNGKASTNQEFTLRLPLDERYENKENCD